MGLKLTFFNVSGLCWILEAWNFLRPEIWLNLITLFEVKCFALSLFCIFTFVTVVIFYLLNVVLLHDILIAVKFMFALITVVIFYLQMYCLYMMSKRACYFQYVKLLYSWRRSMILFWSKVGEGSESWSLLNSMRW